MRFLTKCLSCEKKDISGTYFERVDAIVMLCSKCFTTIKSQHLQVTVKQIIYVYLFAYIRFTTLSAALSVLLGKISKRVFL